MKSDSNFLSIDEEYISPIVLPKEPICGWIKWDEKTEYDKIVLRYEADVVINTIFDVNDTLLSNPKEGMIEIPKSMLQLEGFFGFNATYAAKPESKRKLSFGIDFINKEESKTITLTTMITRPMVEVVHTTCDQIIVSAYGPTPTPISFDIRVGGDAMPENEKLLIGIFGKNIQLKIKDPELSPSQISSFTGEVAPEKQMTLTGQGNGMIRLTLEYTDVMGNQYSTILQEIPVIIEGKRSETIPISRRSTNEEIPLFVTT